MIALKPTTRPADKSVPRMINVPDTPKAIMNRTDVFDKIFIAFLTVKKLSRVKPV